MKKLEIGKSYTVDELNKLGFGIITIFSVDKLDFGLRQNEEAIGKKDGKDFDKPYYISTKDKDGYKIIRRKQYGLRMDRTPWWLVTEHLKLKKVIP